MVKSFAHSLGATGLFDALSDGEFEEFVQVVGRVDVPAGTTFLHEGEIGEDMYVILEGTVQVFATTSDGQEIVLRKLEAGAYFGEQALLSVGANRRNASVRTVSDTALLKIGKADFQRVLAADSPLKEHLLRVGSQQVHEILMQQSALFRALDLSADTGEWYDERSFAEGETIFTEGSPGDTCYLVLSGTAGVYKQEAEGEALLTRLRPGQCFGELALIRRAPRMATVRAESPLQVLAIEGEHFLRMYERSPQLRDYMETLQKIHVIPRRGVMTRHAGKFMGKDCITTLHHLEDGVSIMSSRVIGQDIFNMSVVGIEAEAAETLCFRDLDAGTERELVVIGGRIIGVTAGGPWDELGEVYCRVVDCAPFYPWQGRLFQEKGTLRVDHKAVPHNDSEIICECMAVTRGTLRRAIQSGCQTLEALVESCGASMVCGGCRPRVQAMVGRADWVPVMAAEIIQVTPDTYALPFRPCGSPLLPAKPGQHIVVQTQIDGRWVERPYTLTSASSETDYREITVKREPHGFFSRWIIDNCREDTLIRISNPQGEHYLEATEQRPVVCLVAGIGMTPALAMCRSIIRDDTGQRLRIHYSAPTRDRFAYVDELRAAANEHANIALTLRATREEGHLTRHDVEQLVRSTPDALFCVCGPDGYLRSVQEYLKTAGVPAERIWIEAFTHTGNPAARKTDVKKWVSGLFRGKTSSPIGNSTRPAALRPASAEPERHEDFSRMPYSRFVEKVLNKEIVLPKASRIAARLQSEEPELFDPNNMKMAFSTAAMTARVGITAALLAWSAVHGQILLLGLLTLVQGVNYYGVSAIVHDCAHEAAFTKKWLNRLVGTVFSLPLLSRFSAFRRSHLLHHRNNQSFQDPKVKPRSGSKARIAHFVFDRIYTPLPAVVQNFLIITGMLLILPPVVLIRYEFSVFQRIRSSTDVVEVAANLALWAGAFAMLDWQVAAAILVGPLFVGYAFIAIVFGTHASEYSLNSEQHDPAEYELMIFNITNLTMGSWLDRLGCYFHHCHVEHHLFPSIPFHGLTKASEFVRREYGQYLLPERKLSFAYMKRGYLDNTRNYVPVDIAGKRYYVGSFFDSILFGQPIAAESDS